MSMRFTAAIKMIAGLALVVPLTACHDLMVNGLETVDAVAYPMTSPEWVMRDLGGQRYLLGQWDVPLNGNGDLRMRYYDRKTGMLTRMPRDVLVFRDGFVGNKLGAVRYTSDAPNAIAFLSRRQTRIDGYCNADDHSANGVDYPQRKCGFIEIVLSLDGGHSFTSRQVRIPSRMGFISVDARQYEFAIVRNNTIYLGMYLKSTQISEKCYLSFDNERLETIRRVAYARRFTGLAVADSSDIFLGVLAMPLPATDGMPLSAERIPKDLSADLLTGPALLDFDLGQPMVPLVTAPTDVPEPRGIYTRADRDAYIARLREQFPKWAAHQSSEGMPRTQQWRTVEQRNAMRAHDQMRVTDSIEWIPYDWPPR